MMNLSISNIAWEKKYDSEVYKLMNLYGFTGLEIAPTRVFYDNPYDHFQEAKEWSDALKSAYGLKISSMQSIWYGKKENIFESVESRKILLDYTKKAIRFAETIGCGNLVFGCPKNRFINNGANSECAISFFKELGDYAAIHNTVIAMEANPPIYNTNFINDTFSAISLIEKVDSKGFLLNLDVGTMVENSESITLLKGKEHLINHVHISEPMLMPLKKREIHLELASLLRKTKYAKCISIEVSRQEKLDEIEKMLRYVTGIFGDE